MADDDARRYRDGYPGLREQEDPKARLNQQFYANQIRSKPDGDYIEEILHNWWGDYDKLEEDHGYVQWLFPIRERGQNCHSQALTAKEREEMAADPAVLGRLRRSYILMLDFFGMELVDPATGKVRKARGWQLRYHNLAFASYGHNSLRITRIIKSLGELGLAHYQAPWCEHLVEEVFDTGALAECRDSLLHYWIPMVKDDAAREKLMSKVIRIVKDDAARDSLLSYWIPMVKDDAAREKLIPMVNDDAAREKLMREVAKSGSKGKGKGKDDHENMEYRRWLYRRVRVLGDASRA